MLKLKECRKFMKKCKCCGKVKNIHYFRKQKDCADGYRNKCKECSTKIYTYICQYCGKEFKGDNKKPKYCSRKCMGLACSNSLIIQCEQCGKEIKIKPSLYKAAEHHFCNNECYRKWRSDENNPLCNNKEILCEYCKKSIKRAKSLIERRNHHFCSQECRGKWQSENINGENSPLWNPNLTDKDRQGRRNIEGYSNWSYNVKFKYKFTCQCCGDNKGGNLESHHLNSYNWDKENRTNIDNGICLCKKCHKLFHKIYGNRHNTKEQFKEFKQRYINKEFEEVV